MFIIFVILLIPMAHMIYVSLYFKSEKFHAIKKSIEQYTKNCNDLNDHIENLKSSYLDIRSFNYGESYLKDDSNYSMKRKKWREEEKNNRTHNCSASVCQNAFNQPFKYFCKYFDIKINEKTLSIFEEVMNNFAAADQGKILLKNERDTIVSNIGSSIPHDYPQLPTMRYSKII